MGDTEEDAECKICKKNVLDNDSGMFCEGECQSWYHISCVGISLSKYKKITSDISDILIWMCAKCREKLKTLMKGKQCDKVNKTLLEKVENINETVNAIKKELGKENQKQTYAQIASTMNSNNKTVKLPENLPSILIKPRNTQNCKQTSSDLEKKIKLDKIGARVKSKKELSNGSVILKFPSSDDLEKVKSETNKILKGSYDIVETSLRNPKIKIPGISLNYTKDEFESQLKKQNSIFTDDEYFKITYIRAFQNKTTNTIYAECSPTLFQNLMLVKRIYLGWERLPVFEDISVLKCFNCQLYHHKGNDCTNKKACKRCSEEHDVTQCQNQIKKCTNCDLSNKKHGTKHSISHEAGDWNCPSYKYFLEIARSRINYG